MRGRLLLAAAILACLAASAHADIKCNDEYKAFEPIVVTVEPSQIPDGAKLRGSFQVDGGQYVQCGEQTFHVWAPPGKHVIRAQGVWALSNDVQVDGQTLPVLMDFGSYSYERTITVAGGDDSPDPPDPPPPGQRVAVIMEESAERTPQQAALYVALRKEWQDDRLLILDDDSQSAQQFLHHAANQPRPCLIVLQGPARSLVRVVPLPSSVAAVKQEVAR